MHTYIHTYHEYIYTHIHIHKHTFLYAYSNNSNKKTFSQGKLRFEANMSREDFKSTKHSQKPQMQTCILMFIYKYIKDIYHYFFKRAPIFVHI